jgi:competence protein ComEC
VSLALPRRRAALPALLPAVRTSVAHDLAFGRFPLWLPVLAIAGVMLAVEAPAAPPLGVLGAVTAVAAVLWVVLGRGRFARLAPVMLALAAVSAGATAVTLQERLSGTPLLERETTAKVAGTILSVERTGRAAQRVVIALEAADLPTLLRRVRLSVRGAPPLSAGDHFEATARLFPPPGPVVPGGYDPARRLFFDGIGATGFTYGAPAITQADPGPLASIERVRAAVEARIAAVLPEENAGFAAALLVGTRGLMPEADVEALRISGLSHILSISGLHMVLVAGTVFAVVRLGLALVPGLALRRPIKKWAAVAGLLAATVYLGLSGASVPTVRAYIMLVIALLAILADRPALTMRTVAIAAALIIAIDPISVLEPGFQMSFLAVVALVAAYEWWGGRSALGRSPLRPVVAFLAGLVMSTLIAGTATTLIGVFHFGRVAPLSVIANAAALPVITWVTMPAGILSLALMPFGLEALPLSVMSASLTVVLAIARQVADWTGESAVVGTIPAASVLLSTFGLLWLALWTAPWRLAGIAFLAAGLALAPFATRWDVLVADEAALVAARGADGALALAGRDEFAAESWLVGDGDGRTPAAATTARCDNLGCTLETPWGAVAVSRSSRTLLEDCRLATVVVSADRVSPCRAAVIDRALLARGAVAARHGADGWEVISARGTGRAWHGVAVNGAPR